MVTTIQYGAYLRDEYWYTRVTVNNIPDTSNVCKKESYMCALRAAKHRAEILALKYSECVVEVENKYLRAVV